MGGDTFELVVDPRAPDAVRSISRWGDESAFAMFDAIDDGALEDFFLQLHFV